MKQLHTKKQKTVLRRWCLALVLIYGVYIGAVSFHLIHDQKKATASFSSVSKEHTTSLNQLASFSSATKVQTGTYINLVKNISIKECNYRVVFTTWFSWSNNNTLDFTTDHAFQLYNAYINKKSILKNSVSNGVHYQCIQVDATITENFDTARFPLGSSLLHIRLESNYDANQMIFEPDSKESGIENLNLSSYQLKRFISTTTLFTYPNTMNNQTLLSPPTNAQSITCVQVYRNSLGLYMKCFIALFGTITWVLITIYACANHRVNPLATIPPALFGTITNIMVSANILPEISCLGLAEFVNFFSILVILTGALIIISINKLREENEVFATYFGRILFYLLLFLCLAGQILMPLSAFEWGGIKA